MMPGFRTKKAFFANITGTSKQTKFLFHLHEQAPDQKKHLKVLLKTNWKTEAYRVGKFSSNSSNELNAHETETIRLSED